MALGGEPGRETPLEDHSLVDEDTVAVEDQGACRSFALHSSDGSRLTADRRLNDKRQATR